MEQRSYLAGNVVHETRHRDAFRGRREGRVGRSGERAARMLATIREERRVAPAQWAVSGMAESLKAIYTSGMIDGQLSCRSETKEQWTSAITPLTRSVRAR